MRTSVKGIIYGTLAAICYGTNPLGALNLYKLGFVPESVLCMRFSFAILLLALILFFNGKARSQKIEQIFAIRAREIFVLAILGVLFASSALTLFAAFNYIEAGLASTLLFLYPLEVVAIMCTFFKEKLTLKTLAAIILSFIGIALLYKGGCTTLSTTGVLLVFLSSITYAVYIVLVNRANLHMGSVKMTFYVMIFCLISLLIYSVTFGIGLPQIPATYIEFIWGLMLGLIPTVLSLVFMAKSIKLVGSTPTAIMGALEPITAVFIGTVFFGELLTLRLIVGIIFILTAVTLVAFHKRSAK